MSCMLIKELLPFLYRTAPQVAYVYMQTASIERASIEAVVFSYYSLNRYLLIVRSCPSTTLVNRPKRFNRQIWSSVMPCCLAIDSKVSPLATL